MAISSLSVEELGYIDEKKEKGKKDEIHDEQSKKDNLRNTGEEERKGK